MPRDTARPGGAVGGEEWIFGWVGTRQPSQRNRREEALRLFVPGAVVMAAAAALSVVLMTTPVEQDGDDAGSPVVVVHR